MQKLELQFDHFRHRNYTVVLPRKFFDGRALSWPFYSVFLGSNGLMTTDNSLQVHPFDVYNSVYIKKRVGQHFTCRFRHIRSLWSHEETGQNSPTVRKRGIHFAVIVYILCKVEATEQYHVTAEYRKMILQGNKIVSIPQAPFLGINYLSSNVFWVRWNRKY